MQTSTPSLLLLAHNGIEFLLPLILLTAIFILSSKRFNTIIQLYRYQSMGLVMITFLNGWAHQSHNFIPVGFLTLLGKVFLIPGILMWVSRKIKMPPLVDSHLSLPTSIIVGSSLCVLAFYLTHSLHLHDSPAYTDLLSAGVSLLLLGLFIMITHKNAMTQILGLYVLDNGIYCLASATVFEMPLIIEMGLMLELLLSVLVMGIWVYRIKQSFDSINVENLKRLKG